MRYAHRVWPFLIFGLLVPLMVAAETPSDAPLNPAFLHYLQRGGGKAGPVAAATGRRLGAFPGVTDLTYLRGRQLFGGAIGAVPQRYDLRELGRVTPVRDQGYCGACWTFAAMASLESALAPSELADFSENHLKNTAGFDREPCDGGSYEMAAAYLARWGGPVSEADDPYDPYTITSPGNLPVRKHIQNTITIPDRSGPTDNLNIKSALIEYGALFAHMCWADENYREAAYAYYDSYSYSRPGMCHESVGGGHAVTIVGWDDAFPGALFPTAAPGNGAFIVKNSWGPEWGDNGYFYLSYYDRALNGAVVFYEAQTSANYDRVYQYDPLGRVAQTGFSSETASFANIFVAQESETVRAVSFPVAAPDAAYTISVYTDVAGALPASGTLVGELTGIARLPGYQTFPLDKGISVASGTRFAIVVRLRTPGFTYPIPIHYAVDGYSSSAVSEPGRSFISSSGVIWTDATLRDPTRSVCLKAFTTANGPASPARMVLPAAEATLKGTEATFTWTPVSSALEFVLFIGTEVGKNDVASLGAAGTSISLTATGLPEDGRKLYVRLYTHLTDAWRYNDYVYTASTGGAVIVTPAPGSTLASGDVTFTWSRVDSALEHVLAVGTYFGGDDIAYKETGTDLSVAVTGLPTDGRKLYVRLYTRLPGLWQYHDYVYTAVSAGQAEQGAIFLPAPNSTLAGSTVTFAWTAAPSAVEYALYVGTAVGSNDIASRAVGSALSHTVAGIPADGRKLYVRFWVRLPDVWQFTDYVYTAATAGQAGILSPLPGSTLAGSSVKFTWTAAASAVEYALYVGTAAGGNDIASIAAGTALTATAGGLLADGRKLYVRLWVRLPTVWQYTDYVYTAYTAGRVAALNPFQVR